MLITSTGVIASDSTDSTASTDSTTDLLTLPAKSLRISEIGFNPVGVDEGNEFIEVEINLEEIGKNSICNLNLSLLKIADNYGNDTLSQTDYVNCSSKLILIVGESTELSNFPKSCTIFKTDGLIGNGLGNSGDNIFLWYNNQLMDQVAYSDQSSAGQSLNIPISSSSGNRSSDSRGDYQDREKNPYIFAKPTPCLFMQDSLANLSLVSLNKTNESNLNNGDINNHSLINNLNSSSDSCANPYENFTTFTTLVINESSNLTLTNYTLFCNNSLYVNSVNSTGTESNQSARQSAQYNNSNNNLNNSNQTDISNNESFEFQCPIGLSIQLQRQEQSQKNFYLSGETIKYYLFYETGSGPIKYWFEDYQGNIIKNPIITSTNSQKRFTPHLSKTQVLRIVAESNLSFCEKQRTEEYVTVISETENPETLIEYSLDFSPEQIHAEKDGTLSMHIVRGNTLKRTISISFKQDKRRIAKDITIAMLSKNSESNLKIPFYLTKLDSNSDSFEVEVTGLGVEKSKTFQYSPDSSDALAYDSDSYESNKADNTDSINGIDNLNNADNSANTDKTINAGKLSDSSTTNKLSSDHPFEYLKPSKNPILKVYTLSRKLTRKPVKLRVKLEKNSSGSLNILPYETFLETFLKSNSLTVDTTNLTGTQTVQTAVVSVNPALKNQRYIILFRQNPEIPVLTDSTVNESDLYTNSTQKSLSSRDLYNQGFLWYSLFQLNLTNGSTTQSENQIPKHLNVLNTSKNISDIKSNLLSNMLTGYAVRNLSPETKHTDKIESTVGSLDEAKSEIAGTLYLPAYLSSSKKLLNYAPYPLAIAVSVSIFFWRKRR